MAPERGYRSAVVGLISCDDVIVPVARHRHRVDREDLVAGGDQRCGPRATVGLDADLHPPAAVTGPNSAQPCGTKRAINACNAAIPPGPSGTRRAANRPRRRPPRYDDLQPSRHRRTTSSSPLPPGTPTSAARRRQQRSHILAARIQALGHNRDDLLLPLTEASGGNPLSRNTFRTRVWLAALEDANSGFLFG